MAVSLMKQIAALGLAEPLSSHLAESVSHVVIDGDHDLGARLLNWIYPAPGSRVAADPVTCRVLIDRIEHVLQDDHSTLCLILLDMPATTFPPPFATCRPEALVTSAVCSQVKGLRPEIHACVWFVCKPIYAYQ